MNFINSRARQFACLCLLLGGLGRGYANDWPRFLGPHANGKSDETGLADSIPKEGLPILWKKEIGSGYSAPSILGNKLVQHHRVGKQEIVECFEADTGKSLWKVTSPCEYEDPYGYNNGPRCTPTLTTNRVYTFGVEGRLLCLDLATGRKIWEHDTAKEFNVPQAFFGVGSTPLLEGGKLFVMTGGQPNAGVTAYDAVTGKALWSSVGKGNWEGVPTIGWRTENPYKWTGFEKLSSYSSLAMATFHGKKHLLCLMRQGLCSVDPDTGKVNFSRWFQSFANDSVNAMTPIVKDDMILISSAYYRSGAVLLKVKPDGTSYETIWRDPRRHPMDSADRDPATGTWKIPALELHWNTPILLDGFLYAFSGRDEPDATFRCVEFHTGKLMWSRDETWSKHPPHGTLFDTFGRGSAILADGRLYAFGEAGILGIFKPNPEKLEEISRWQVPEMAYPTWSGPVLANKRLYLRSENRLLCLDLRKTK